MTSKKIKSRVGIIFLCFFLLLITFFTISPAFYVFDKHLTHHGGIVPWVKRIRLFLFLIPFVILLIAYTQTVVGLLIKKYLKNGSRGKFILKFFLYIVLPGFILLLLSIINLGVYRNMDTHLIKGLIIFFFEDLQESFALIRALVFARKTVLGLTAVFSLYFFSAYKTAAFLLENARDLDSFFREKKIPIFRNLATVIACLVIFFPLSPLCPRSTRIKLNIGHPVYCLINSACYKSGRADRAFVSNVYREYKKHYLDQVLPGVKLQNPMNVVIILIDALRPDHLSCAGYQRKTSPFLDSLVERGALFPGRTYSQSSESSRSEIAIMTGVYPFRDLEVERKNFITLHDILKKFGYHTMLFLTSRLDWHGQEEIYEKNMDQIWWKYCSQQKWDKNNIDRVVLREIWSYLNRNRPEPFLLRMSLMAPHRRFQMEDLNPFLPVSTAQGVLTDQSEESINEYDNAVCYADDCVRQIFRVMKRIGAHENTIYVVVADHGEAFGEHDTHYHASTLYQEQIEVPLIIYSPKIDFSQIKLKYANSVDILPTICDILGLPIPELCDGKSLLQPRSEDEFVTTSYLFLRNMFAVITPNYKYIVNEGNRTRELYDLKNDPQEEKDLLKTGGVSNKDLDYLEELYREKVHGLSIFSKK